MKLASVDLFTGLGGFVKGLSNLYDPILYCDSSLVVNKNLHRLMNSGHLPRANIVPDVRNTDEIVNAVNGRHVDLLTAGFPCVGFSMSGRRAGLMDKRSALVASVLDVVKRLRPSAVMLENVPGILNSNERNDIRKVVDDFLLAGYECRWTTCSASDVGLPQKRERWFCLCVPVPTPTDKASQLLSLADALSANAERWQVPPMPSLLAPRASSYNARYFLLGNSVVPAVVNLAFRRLVQMDTNVPRQSSATNEMRRRAKGAWPLHGFWRDATLHARHYTRPSVTNPPDHAIVLCPLQYQPVYTKRKGRHNLPVTLRRTVRLWPTPRATAPRHSKTLTVRTCGDLPTAALFACSVQGRHQMKAVDGMTVNPEFVEWLMGYPPGWTDLVLEKHMTQSEIELTCNSQASDFNE